MFLKIVVFNLPNHPFLLGFSWNKPSAWWFQIFFIFTPIWGRWTHFDVYIFQKGWFNHQLDHPFWGGKIYFGFNIHLTHQLPTLTRNAKSWRCRWHLSSGCWERIYGESLMTQTKTMFLCVLFFDKGQELCPYKFFGWYSMKFLKFETLVCVLLFSE